MSEPDPGAPIPLDAPQPTWVSRPLPRLAPGSEEVRLPELERARGFEVQAPPWVLGRELFLRGLGFVYLVAFISLAGQLPGLFGPRGLAPIQETLALLTARHQGWSEWPSLFWWTGAAPETLALVAWGGAGAAFLLMAGLLPQLALAACWVGYASFVSLGQPFLSFQWDMLLLETGLVGFLLSPGTWWLPRGRARPAPPALRWLAWFLLWRLMFFSGVVKLASGDPCWRDGTALAFHWWTQPLPNPVSWYMAQLPAWANKTLVWVTFGVELALPFAIPLGRWGRRAALAGFILLQVGIAVTGNFGFFNLLTLVLCLSLVDDRDLQRLCRNLWRVPVTEVAAIPARVVQWSGAWVGWALALLVALPMGLDRVGWMVPPWGPSWLQPAHQWALERAAAWHLCSPYGLFAVMTTERPEISIEGTLDGRTWAPYVFRWKPGPLDRGPGEAWLHMPRLDWQLWFAALRWPGAEPWQVRLEERLLAAEPAVLSLLESAPFGEQRPRAIRWRVDRYRFSDAGSPEADRGDWWVVTQRGPSAGGLVRTQRRGTPRRRSPREDRWTRR